MSMRFFAIRTGILVFVDRKGTLLLQEAEGEPFNKPMMAVTNDDRFVMAAGMDCGVFVRNLDPTHDISYALALLPSYAPILQFLPKEMTYARLITTLGDEESLALLKEGLEKLSASSSDVGPARADFDLAVASPIWSPRLLGKHLLATMNSRLEARVCGGNSPARGSLPEVVSAALAEFQSRGISVLHEESIVDIGNLRQVVVINPYAKHPSDYVRSQSPVQLDAEIALGEVEN
jgi:hypothetical protein